MAIKFNCPKCKKELVVKDELAGRQGKCPACQSVLTVPAATATAVTRPAPAPVKKKPADEEMVSAEIIEEEEVAEVIDEEDEAPRKKKKPRRDDDDEDEDERPSKSKKKSSRRDDDDDDDDDRPSRKKKRRDDDEDEEDSKKQSPRKRRAGFARAALGMRLNFIGHMVYAGAIGLAVISTFIVAAMSSSRGGGGGGGFLKVLSYVTVFTLLGAMILNVVGSAFTITTPSKNGEIGLSIATVATAGLALLLGIVLVINFLSDGMGGAYFAWTIPFLVLNPCTGFAEGGGPTAAAGHMNITAIIIILPLAEIGRLTCLALFQWAVGKSQRDRETKKSGFMMAIIAPSVCVGMGIFMWILGLAVKSQSIWVATIFLVLYGGVIGGMLVWYALVLGSSQGTLEDAR